MNLPIGSVRRLILLVGSYMGQRDYERFGIELLQAAGLHVEVWECVDIIQGASTSVPPAPLFQSISRFSSISKLMYGVHQIGSDSVILSILGTSFNARRVHAKLTKAKVPFGVYRSGFAQFSDTKPSATHFIKRFVGKLAAPRALFESFAAKTCGRFLRVRPSYQFLCGGTTAGQFAKGEKTGDLVWAHQLDYDLCLKAGEYIGATKGMYIVYLDDYLPFHPDWTIVGKEPVMTADEHYPRLVTFFRYMEAQLRLPVVIAAHPRSCYEKHPDYFDGRQVIRGRTVDLVRESACVILSASTALNFAVIYNKPLIFVCTDGMRRYYPFIRLIENLSKVFGKTPVNLDREISLDLAAELAVDSKGYARYRSAYIKCPETPELNSWIILAQYLKKESEDGRKC